MEEKKLTDEQAEALASSGVKIPESVTIEYIDQTGDDELTDLAEAYNGKHDSDRAFAMDMADQLGSVPDNAEWPLTCIDWDRAGRDLMFDYFEIEGYYFRSL